MRTYQVFYTIGLDSLTSILVNIFTYELNNQLGYKNIYQTLLLKQLLSDHSFPISITKVYICRIRGFAFKNMKKLIKELQYCSPLQTQKHYALPLIRQSKDSYQPSQRQLQRQLPRSTMLVQVPNQLRLSEEAIQRDNPRR
ncbi:Hypothetical_protein [Hexamita inflata]|uniref:Hypothetical_protein n=1 Tax=Hexamita inflata TaxID=28002 RepID=A0AA86NAH7_9EUKA|nr:Hypothetical protein HINF_LOCUS3744 [Hexamita inflata]